MNTESKGASPTTREGLLASGGALSGFAAFIGASCCVLPIVLVNLGVSSALVGKLAFFAEAQPYFMGLTTVLILAGFGIAYWKGRRPSRRALILLIVATVLAITAYVLPFYEGQILRWFNL